MSVQQQTQSWSSWSSWSAFPDGSCSSELPSANIRFTRKNHRKNQRGPLRRFHQQPAACRRGLGSKSRNLFQAEPLGTEMFVAPLCLWISMIEVRFGLKQSKLTGTYADTRWRSPPSPSAMAGRCRKACRRRSRPPSCCACSCRPAVPRPSHTRWRGRYTCT